MLLKKGLEVLFATACKPPLGRKDCLMQLSRVKFKDSTSTVGADLVGVICLVDCHAVLCQKLFVNGHIKTPSWMRQR